MRYSFLFLLSFSFFLSSCSNDRQVKLVENLTKEIKEKFVPDGRTAFFNVEILKTKAGLVVKGETNISEAKDALLEKIKGSEISFIDSLQVLNANYGVVRLSVCNIRSKPKHSAELSTQATLGSPLRIYKKQEDWYYVQTPDNYLGWLDKDGFTSMTDEEFNTWQQSEKVIITQNTKAVNAESAVVSDLLPGNILMKKGTEGDLEKVAFPDGREGFISVQTNQNLNTWLTEISADTARIFQAAKRMMGSPYLWGGTSPKGMDCSGYTKQIFFENGLLLPRDASQQVRVGEEIETDTTLANLLPGDLLFFGRKATAEKKERIWHVAIYLGDGKIIHSAGNVKVQSLRRGDADFAENRLETFVRAKRILGSEGKNGVVKLKENEWYPISS